ncbi:MAG TPA: hypothetical protein VGV59_11860 [Pyrinomonadaceae bacterium]|nr:hypothetical protein [Pyrinomonadaceae bacterium]
MKNLNAHRASTHDGGYALVALLALMSILALALVSAAPSLHQQNMREREKEAIFRGEEVAEAIAIYHRIKSAPPKSMQELLDGVSVGTKKIQILRPSAAIDPLSSTGEWRYIKRGDKELSDFQQKVMLYTQLRQLPMREQWMQPYYSGITGLADLREDEEAPCGENNSSNSSDGFIGVVSRNQCASILTYYGIERRDKWVFTPLFR